MDSPSEDRPSRDQGHKCANALQKKKSLQKIFFWRSQKKRSSPKIFQAIFRKKRLNKNFSGPPQNFNNSKKVLSRPIFEDLGLRGQGQGLQNVFSWTPPLVTGSSIVAIWKTLLRKRIKSQETRRHFNCVYANNYYSKSTNSSNKSVKQPL